MIKKFSLILRYGKIFSGYQWQKILFNMFTRSRFLNHWFDDSEKYHAFIFKATDYIGFYPFCYIIGVNYFCFDPSKVPGILKAANYV